MLGSKYECFICGSPVNLQRHHMVHGSRRAAADRHDLTCMLCVNCHARLHDKGEHDRELEKMAQTVFEASHGHDAWMAEFSKSYL